MLSTVHVKNRKNLGRFMTPGALQGLIKNLERIRKLVIVGEDMLDLFIPRLRGIWTYSSSERTLSLQPPPVTCTNLVNLVVAIYREQENHFAEDFCYNDEPTLSANMERGILGIVRQSSRLKSIKIENKMSPRTVLAIAHGASPTLQELEFQSLISVKTTKSLLKDLPQHITKLHLRGIEDRCGFEFLYKDNGETPPIDANNTEDALIDHHALTSLHLCGDLEGHEEYILLPFLTTCSTRLTNFQTIGIGCYKNKKVHDALARLNIYMETIHFPYDSGHDENAEDAEIAAIFALSQHMKVINLYRCSNTGPQAIAAIPESAAHLECLHLPCHSQVSAADLQAIISQAKKLRTLTMYFPGMRCGTLLVLSLSAAEFLAADWASSSLERFGCVFRVPRPNDHVPQEHQDPIWNNPTLEHSRQIQRQVYRHMAKQTHLYEVYLGAL
ncbi:hypothetical protein CPC16_007565 [Podila verticillata]|nr:hypothetical protein CPC16_007565 [Podila verticillata]